jgi:hypothetical protein
MDILAWYYDCSFIIKIIFSINASVKSTSLRESMLIVHNEIWKCGARPVFLSWDSPFLARTRGSCGCCLQWHGGTHCPSHATPLHLPQTYHWSVLLQPLMWLIKTFAFLDVIMWWDYYLNTSQHSYPSLRNKHLSKIFKSTNKCSGKPNTCSRFNKYV